MTLDNTTLRLIRAASQAVADECSSILGEPSAAHPVTTTTTVVEMPAAAPAPKATRKKAAAAPAPEPTAAPQPEPEAPAPEPEAPAPEPEAPAPQKSTSTATADDLARVAAEVSADPAKAARYNAWKETTEFKGMKLREIPNVGDNYDRVYEALNRANV